MRALAGLIETARSTGDWRPLVGAIPYLQFLGVRLEERAGERLVCLSYADHLVGNPVLPALHGGTLGAVLEAAAQLELLQSAASSAFPKTITTTIDFLRSAKPQDTFFRGVIIRQGRRVATVQSTAWQDDRERPVAIATVHLLVLGPEAAAL